MEHYRFFGSADGDVREYNQFEFAEVLNKVSSNGYFVGVDNELSVSENTPVDMTVLLNTGEAWINGYWYKNDAVKQLTITTANATNPRIDSVILRLDTVTDRIIEATILTGTASVSPVAPTLTQTLETYEIELARIYVGAGVTTILNANITPYKTACMSGIKQTTALLSEAPTGFTNNENITVSYNSTTRKITLTGTFEAYYQGIKLNDLISGWQSPAHADVAGNYYLYYNGSGFVFGTTPWSFDMMMIAFVQYNSHRIAIREVHGLMAWQSHKEFHDTIGAYKCAGGDFSNFVLASTTATNRRPQISITSVCDEDLKTNLPALTTNSYTQRFLTGSAVRSFTIEQPEIIANNGSVPFYNQFNGSAWVQTLMANNQYGAIFVIAAPMTADTDSQKYRYMFVQPQQVSTSLATIQALTPSSLTHGDSANLLSEFVFIGKIIIQASTTSWSITSVEKLEGTKISQVAVSGNFLSIVTTDSTLSGLGTPTSPLTIPNKVSYTVYTATIPSASWTGGSAPYSKDVTVTGILSTDEPIIDLALSGVYATDVTTRDNWSKIYRIVTSTDTITCYADSVPSADINIQLVVVR